MAGDYARKRIIYSDVSTDLDFTVFTGNTTLVPAKANNTIEVQRIIIMVKTSAANAITFEDNSSPTPTYVAKIPASPGADTRWDFDFGPEGKSLPAGKAFMMDMTAGNAGHVEVNAFYKPVAVQ